jgi:hypothetical protein
MSLACCEVKKDTLIRVTRACEEVSWRSLDKTYKIRATLFLNNMKNPIWTPKTTSEVAKAVKKATILMPFELWAAPEVFDEDDIVAVCSCVAQIGIRYCVFGGYMPESTCQPVGQTSESSRRTKLPGGCVHKARFARCISGLAATTDRVDKANRGCTSSARLLNRFWSGAGRQQRN